jgi:two-component system sensor histidine kinase KdpD
MLFRVYLGYARGVGATTTMLDEARRRESRGTDVVVAAYRVHGDPTQALAGLEVLGRGRTLAPQMRLNPEAVMVRNPEVVCVDDLAAEDVSGRPVLDSVPSFLAAGITVLASLHLLSVRSAAAAFADVIGGTPPLVIDDLALEAINELELVDVPPADLLDRLRDQAVLPPGELATAMQQELRISVLEALRATAFRVIAEHADRQLVAYMRESHPEAPWDVRERIVLCLPPRQGLERRIRGAADYAARQDAKFSVVTVRTRSMNAEQKEWVGGYATLTHQLGGEFVHLHGRSVAPALVDYIRSSLATEVILGRRHHRWRPGDTTSEVIRRLSGVTVHILRARE